VKRWKTIAAAGLLAVASIVALAPAASAWSIGVSAGCSGTLIDSSPLYDGSKKAGRAELYYSSAHGGTNCTLVKDLVSGSHQMQAFLTVKGAPDYSDDAGKYKEYAGGTFMYPTNGKCVRWGGNLTIGSHFYSYSSPYEHCS
jgi:hypothetical protein